MMIVYVCMNATHVQVSMVARRGCQSLGTAVTGTTCGSWELNLGPVLLAAEPSSLQLLSESLYFNVHI